MVAHDRNSVKKLLNECINKQNPERNRVKWYGGSVAPEADPEVRPYGQGFMTEVLPAEGSK